MRIIIIKSKKYGYKIVTVDDGDFDFLSQFKWHVRKDTHGFYVVRNGKYYNGKRSPIVMHRVIMNASCSQIVDHADGDTLNNQRSNLRFCNPTQNAINRRKIKPSNSGYRGILMRENGKFMVRVSFGGRKRKSFGTFEKIEDAIDKYNEEVKKYHGEFAILNIKK